jgi:hypothetical protein
MVEPKEVATAPTYLKAPRMVAARTASRRSPRRYMGHSLSGRKRASYPPEDRSLRKDKRSAGTAPDRFRSHCASMTGITPDGLIVSPDIWFTRRQR